MSAGFAVEFALKACIMRKERMNGWPDRDSRPELHSHDLRRLFAVCGLGLADVPRELRGAMRTVLDWDRAHEYSTGRMSRAYARSMLEATFEAGGMGGVVGWLKTLP